MEQLDVDVVLAVAVSRCCLKLLSRAFLTVIGEGTGEGEKVEKFD